MSALVPLSLGAAARFAQVNSGKAVGGKRQGQRGACDRHRATLGVELKRISSRVRDSARIERTHFSAVARDPLHGAGLRVSGEIGDQQMNIFAVGQGERLNAKRIRRGTRYQLRRLQPGTVGKDMVEGKDQTRRGKKRSGVGRATIRL